MQCTTSKLLGLGGMAKVYGGELEDGTQVVLKTQRFEGRGADHSLEVEIELFKKLFHRNIVHCVGVGVSPAGHLIIGFRRAYQNPLLLMSKASVDEGMRRDKRARYPCLPLDTAIDLTYELLNALAYLERLGFVHHDVKLANLLIDVASKERPLEGHEVFGRVVRRNYRAVLIDFGATRSRNYLEAWNRGEAAEGLAPQITPFYAPPEAVVETRRADGELGLTFHPTIDVYAAALLLYALLTGHPPYSHLKNPPDHSDMESVIAAKSAERRAEIEPVSAEILRRVVYEETKWSGGERAAFDESLYRFMAKRLDPDPELRGTAAEMKREFEKLCKIRSRRGHDERGVGGSRVFLPFQQELVVVGGGREHPLMRAARLYGLEGKQARPPSDRYDNSPPKSERLERITRRRDSERLRAALEEGERPGAQEKLDWLKDMDATEAPPGSSSSGEGRALPARRAPPPKRRRPSPTPPPKEPPLAPSPTQPMQRIPAPGRTPPSKRRPPRGKPGARTPRPGSKTPVPGPAGEEGAWGRQTQPRGEREDLLRRAGRRRRRRTTLQPHLMTRPGSGTPRPEDKKNPTGRGYPSAEQAACAHCLLSPVLDTPLLLSRERTYSIGRDPSTDVRIKSDLVSRRHAEVAWDGKSFVITDLGSLNGTTLNGFRLQAPVPLHDEDRIGFGGFEFVVRVLTGEEWTIDEGGGSTRIFKGKEDWGRMQTPTFSGDLTRLALRDVVEIVDWKRHTGALTIADDGRERGTIWFDAGKMIHARSGTSEGVEAAVDLFTSRRGQFVFKHGATPPNAANTIDATLDEVWKLVRERG